MFKNIRLGLFSKEDTNFLKGVSIILIALHNYYRWVNPITGENEFWFSTANYLKSYVTLMSNPFEIFNVFFNFLGFYGVQGFVIISAYGLTISYRQKRPAYGKFIVQRFNKLYPAFFFAAVFLVVFMIIQSGQLISLDMLKDIGLQLTLLANFVPGKAMSACGPWWFYSFIFQFYVVFPLMIRIADKWGAKGLIAISVLGYIFTILMFPVMAKVNLNPYQLVLGHIPEFSLGIFLAMKKDLKIPFWVVIIALLVLIAGNIYVFAWPFANLAAALLLWVAVSQVVTHARHTTTWFRVIAFIGVVSMYIFAIQGFTRWSFVNMANYLGNPFTSLVLGLLFLAFATGIAFVMMKSEDGFRGWISSATTAGSRYLRFFSVPVIVMAGLALLFISGSAVAKRAGQPGGKSAVLAADSNYFEVPEAGRNDRYLAVPSYDSTKCLLMPANDSYSPRVEISFDKLDPDKLAAINASVMLFAKDTAAAGHLIVEILDKRTGERFTWKSNYLSGDKFIRDRWFPATFTYNVPKEYLFPNYFARVYVWNPSKGNFYIDNLKAIAVGK